MSQDQLADEVVAEARTRHELAVLDTGISDTKARKILRDLRAGALESGIKAEDFKEKLPSYLVSLIDKMDVELPAPDTKSAFWSWILDKHPGLGQGECIPSMHVAGAYADLEAGDTNAVRYLEGTPGGKELSELYLWDQALHNVLEMDEAEGKALASGAWDALSQRYAAKTENEALFFMAELNPATVAYQTESRQLRQDGKLGIINFMYPPPLDKYTGLAPETQELLTSQAVRAQVHTFGYDENDPKYTPLTKAGHLDLDHVKSLPTPEAQRAAVLEVCARVAAMDGPARAADVEKYVEEIKVIRPDHEVTLPSSTDLAWAHATRAKSDPVVSTHGAFLPGVEVNARTGPQPLQPHETSAQAVAGAQFMPGVALKPTPLPAPSAAPAPVSTALEQTPAVGMGE